VSAQVHYFRVGIFTIVGIVLAVGAIIVFGSIELTPRPSIMMETYLEESVQGLDIGSSVKMKGVQMGHVDEIGFVQTAYELDTETGFTHGNFVYVRFTVFPFELFRTSRREIDARIDELVRRGMRVRLASQGITGIKYLEVNMLDPDRFPPFEPSWTPEGKYVPSAPGAFTKIVESIDQVTRKLSNISIEEIVDEVLATLKAVREGVEAANIGQIGQKASLVLDDVHGTLKGQEVQATLSDLRETMASAKSVMARVDDIVENEDLRKSIKDLQGAIESLKETIAKMPRLVDRFGTTLAIVDEMLLESRPTIEEILLELRMTLENIRELSDTGKRYPSSLILGDKPPEAKPEENPR